MLDTEAIEYCLERIKWSDGLGLNFQSRENRDQVFALAKRDPRTRNVRIKKSSMRNQLLDPRYTVEGRGPDQSLGNEYRGFQGTLYSIEVANLYGPSHF